jgi:ankyrin repeat protein
MFKHQNRIVFLLTLCCTAFSPLHAAIVTHGHGETETGRIGDIVGSEIQFYSERFYILKSETIKNIEVDQQLSGKDLAQDQESVAKIQLLIDKRNIDVADLQQQAQRWLQDKNYKALEGKAALLLINQSRWGDGSWPIDDFFRAMTSDIPGRSVADYNRRLKQIEAWVAARPDSITAKLSLIRVLVDTGWAHRGSGYSKTVTKDNFQKFDEFLQRAARVAEEIADAGLDNPVIYSTSIRLLNPLGVDKKKLKAFALQSLEANPEFYPVYATTYHALQQKWHGAPGEVQAFIEQVSRKLKKTYPEAIFLAHRRFYKNFEPKEYADMNFNWNNIRLGFERFRIKYHANDADYHLMAMLACLHGDKASALNYFATTSGSWNYLAERIWRKQSKLESYQSWAAKIDPPYYKTIKQALLKNDIPVLTRLVKSSPDLLDIFLHRDLYGDTMLHELAARNDYKMLEVLADLGVSLESRNDLGYTPLQWAAYYGYEESVAILSARGADVHNRQGSKGNQAAHIAAKNGFKSVLAILIKHDPETIKSPNNNQTRALHYAAWNGHLDTVKYILDVAPKEIDQQDKYRYTPLHYAINRGYTDIAIFLVESGADTGLKNKAGYTPLSFARKKGFAEIESYLQNIGAADSQVVDDSEKVKKAGEIYQQSSQYFNQKDYKKAIGIYHKSLEVYPDYYLAYAGLAQVAFDFEKDFVKADRYFDKSIELNPDYVDNYYWKARTNYSLNRPEVYRPLFNKYIELAPDTYNAIDLQKNWSHLLAEQSSITSPPNDYSQYQAYAIASFAILIGILLLLRWRQST